MIKFKLSFARLFFISLFITSISLANVPFSISGTPEPDSSLDNPSTFASLTSQLKQKAVQEWLQGHLGERFPQFEKSITPDFSERYVLDYKVARSGPKRDTLELTGHLDSESLKKWVRLQDARKGTTNVKPLVLFSSTLPTFTFSPAETAERLNNTPLGQTFSNLLSPLFHKINSKPIYAERSTPLSQPARFESDIGALRDYATQMGGNAAIWLHLQACNTCNGGARLDLILYSLPFQRLALAESDDLNAKPNEWSNPERMKAVLSSLFSQFQTGVESSITTGQLFTQPMRLIFEGLQGYKTYKAVESELASSDYASNSFLKKVASRNAEFEFLTSLSADEVAQRIQASEFAGLRVKTQKFDSRTIVVRYSK